LVADALEAQGVPYSIAGSVASSVHGVGRATLDAGLVAALEAVHVSGLADTLRAEFYLDEESIRGAVTRQGSFNVIHSETLLKIDVFVLGDTDFEREAFRRRVTDTLEEEPGARPFPIERPEDNVLHKLLGYLKGGGVSDRRWQDVQGVLRVQAKALDLPHLSRRAASLGLDALLNKALTEAGL
jgi:hypothetical protein